MTWRVIHADCVEWPKSRYSSGYGAIAVNRRMRVAHRYLWEVEHGPVPEGMDLDHLCRNRGCVNLNHLELVTHAENVQRGAKAKLTREDVVEIRRKRLSIREVVARYGIDKSTAWRVIAGRTWVGV